MPKYNDYTKIVVDMDEETAKSIKRLTLWGNPVTEVEGVEKLGALETVTWFHNKGDSLPRWIEVPPVEKVRVEFSSIKELPAWLFSIPTIKEIKAWPVPKLKTVDFGPNPSATLTKLWIIRSNIKSLPDNLFAHALEEVNLSRNKGKERTGR